MRWYQIARPYIVVFFFCACITRSVAQKAELFYISRLRCMTKETNRNSALLHFFFVVLIHYYIYYVFMLRDLLDKTLTFHIHTAHRPHPHTHTSARPTIYVWRAIYGEEAPARLCAKRRSGFLFECFVRHIQTRKSYTIAPRNATHSTLKCGNAAHVNRCVERVYMV